MMRLLAEQMCYRSSADATQVLRHADLGTRDLISARFAAKRPNSGPSE